MESKHSFGTWRCAFSQGIMKMLSWNSRFSSLPPAHWKRHFCPQSHSRCQPKTGIIFHFPVSKKWGITPEMEKRYKPTTQVVILMRFFSGPEGKEHPRLRAKAHMGATPSPAASQVPSQCFPLAKQDGNAPLQLENWVIQLQGARLGETPKLPK